MNQSFLHNRDDTNKGYINFNTIIADRSHQYDGSTTFTASDVETVDITVIVPQFYFDGHTDGTHPASIKISIYLGDSPLTDLTYDFTNGFDAKEDSDTGDGPNIIAHKTFETQTLSASTALTPGDKISIRYEFFGDQPASFIFYKGATFTIASQNQSVKYTQTVQCERIFPDISSERLTERYPTAFRHHFAKLIMPIKPSPLTH